MNRRSPPWFGLLLFGALFASPSDARRATDRATAERTLAEVTATKDHATLARDPVARSRAALERAEGARGASDEEHALLLEALGREWAETARDLVRAAVAERKVDEIQGKTGKTEEQLTRARAVLEDTALRRSRARAQLDELEKGSSKAEAPKP